MTTTSDVANSTGTNLLNGIKNKSEAQALNDRFLKLLVAQMNNQDPLNPLDNAQVTSQMAQINTVTGINGLSDTVQQLMAQFARVETMQAAQLTGRDVLVPGATLTLKGGADQAPVGAGYVLDLPAEKLKVEIKDANGAIVRTIQLGPQPDGIGRFTWDGKTDNNEAAAAGKYTMTVTPTVAGKESSGLPLVVRRVEGVRQDAEGVKLVLSGGSSAGGDVVSYGDIQQIL